MWCLWVADMECMILGLNVKKNVLLYKGNVYKAYTSREKVVRVLLFYAPRWKKSDECSSAGKPKSEHAFDDKHSLQNISYTYVISFFVGFFVACVLLIVISSLA